MSIDKMKNPAGFYDPRRVPKNEEKPDYECALGFAQQCTFIIG
jgi:hypothetical protein